MTGNDIRQIRKALGLPAPAFATVLGVHQSTVHRWEGSRDQAVAIEGVPWSVLRALRQRVLEEEDTHEEVRETGRKVSDALLIGGALVALGLLIAFVCKSK